MTCAHAPRCESLGWPSSSASSSTRAPRARPAARRRVHLREDEAELEAPLLLQHGHAQALDAPPPLLLQHGHALLRPHPPTSRLVAPRLLSSCLNLDLFQSTPKQGQSRQPQVDPGGPRNNEKPDKPSRSFMFFFLLQCTQVMSVSPSRPKRRPLNSIRLHPRKKKRERNHLKPLISVCGASNGRETLQKVRDITRKPRGEKKERETT